MWAVAAEAGVDLALVRRFFGSKEAALTAALTVAMSPPSASPSRSWAAPPPAGNG
jgi:AcrR family transcriptional regulator